MNNKDKILMHPLKSLAMNAFHGASMAIGTAIPMISPATLLSMAGLDAGPALTIGIPSGVFLFLFNRDILPEKARSAITDAFNKTEHTLTKIMGAENHEVEGGGIYDLTFIASLASTVFIMTALLLAPIGMDGLKNNKVNYKKANIEECNQDSAPRLNLK